MARKLALIALVPVVGLALLLRRETAHAALPLPAPDLAPVAEPATVSAQAESSAPQPTRAEYVAAQDASAPGTPLLFDPDADTTFFLRVVAHDSHLPCADTWVTANRMQQESDAHGRFELHFLATSPPELFAGAPGFLEARCAPEPGHETPETAFVLELDRAASLLVILEDAPRSGFPSLSVTLDSDPAADAASWRSYSPSGQGFFDAKGQARIDELPPNVPLRVRVSDGSTKLVEFPDAIALREGETRELHVRMEESCRLSGRAIDERGAQVAGLTLWLLPASSWPGSLVSPSERAQVVATASTDEQGRFAFEAVLPGVWRLAPAVNSHDPGFLVAKDEVAPVAQRVQIPSGGREQSVEYRVQRGLTITGVVLDADGHPSAGMPVSARSESGGMVGRSGSDGHFELGPLPAGSFEITAMASTPIASNAVQADAGARDVVLRLQRLGRIAGRVVDARTGAGVASQVTLERPSQPEHSDQFLWTEPDGSFEFRGLQPGSYALVATPYDERIGILSNVEIGQGVETAGLVITLLRGARLQARSESAGSALLRVEQGGLRIGTHMLEADGKEPITVPAGNVRFLLRTAAGREEVRELRLEAGEERELVFKEPNDK